MPRRTRSSSLRFLIEHGRCWSRKRKNGCRCVQADAPRGQRNGLRQDSGAQFSRARSGHLRSAFSPFPKGQTRPWRSCAISLHSSFDSWAFRVLGSQSPADLLVRRHDENIALLTELLEGPSKEELRPLIGDKAHVIVDEFQDLPGRPRQNGAGAAR